MSAATSLPQQSQLADDAYLSLTAAIRGKSSLRAGMDVPSREECDSATVIVQSRCLVHGGPSTMEYDQRYY
ncbi:MAG TPA: hypothetical protein VFP33_03220 [Gallionella sp.]|nr:hypothetical protein [Gallionella sp.]